MPISPPSFSPAAFSTTPTTVSASPTSTTVVLPASPPMKQSPASGHNKRPISEKQSSSGSESSSDERESSADDQESNDDETNETSESEDKLMDEWDSSSAESSNEAEDDRRKCAPTRRAASSLPKPPATKLDKFISPKKKKATPTYDDASITIIQPKKKRLQRQMSSDSESDDAITNTRPRNKHQKPRFTNAKKSRTPSPSQEDESNDEEKKDKETSKNNRADDDVWAKNDGWDDDGKSRLKFFTHPRVLEWKLRSIPKVKTQEDGGDTGLLINWIVWCGFLTKRQQKLHTCGYGDEATGCKLMDKPESMQDAIDFKRDVEFMNENPKDNTMFRRLWVFFSYKCTNYGFSFFCFVLFFSHFSMSTHLLFLVGECRPVADLRKMNATNVVVLDWIIVKLIFSLVIAHGKYFTVRKTGPMAHVARTAGFDDLSAKLQNKIRKDFQKVVSWYTAIGKNANPPVNFPEGSYPWKTYFGSMNRDGIHVLEHYDGTKKKRKKKRTLMFSFLNQFWPGKTRIELEQQLAPVNLKSDDRIITDIILPTVVAHGDESAGKSTVLKYMTQADIFETGPDMITRMVWRYRLRYSNRHIVPHAVMHVLNKPVFETDDPNEVKKMIRAQHEEIKRSGIAILDQEGMVEIFSNAVPNIDIIDLPGSVASPKEGEPATVSEISRKIARKYLSRTNHIILYVQSSMALERNSVAAGLMYELKCPYVLTVYTKVDNVVDSRTVEPLDNFLDSFRKKGSNYIAVSNYCRAPNMTFAEVREDEHKFFIDHLSPLEYEILKPRLGMNALMKCINEVAESMNKGEWIQMRMKAEQTKLAGVKASLTNIGQEYTTFELCSIVANGLLENDTLLIETMTDTFREMKYSIPQKPERGVIVADFDAKKFASRMCGKLLARLDRVFELSPHKLMRFETFHGEYRRLFLEKLNNRSDVFVYNWGRYADHIMMDFYTGSPLYSPDRWFYALTNCYLQRVLMRLNDTIDIDRLFGQQQQRQYSLYMHIGSVLVGPNADEEQEVGPSQRFHSLKTELESVGHELTAKENEKHQLQREQLQQQVFILENIIAKLPSM